MNIDQGDDRSVDGGEEKQTKDDADDDAEDVAECRAERAADKYLAHVTQHVITHTLRTGSVDIAVEDLQAPERVHGESE